MWLEKITWSSYVFSLHVTVTSAQLLCLTVHSTKKNRKARWNYAFKGIIKFLRSICPSKLIWTIIKEELISKSLPHESAKWRPSGLMCFACFTCLACSPTWCACMLYMLATWLVCFTCSMNLECLRAWCATLNGVLGVLHKIARLKLLTCFLVVCDRGALVNCIFWMRSDVFNRKQEIAKSIITIFAFVLNL